MQMGNTPAPPKPVAAAREITIAQFLEEYPLFRIGQAGEWDTPSTLSLDCWNCKKETTWSHDRTVNDPYGLKLRKYACHLCGRAAIHYLVAQVGKGSYMKVGQYPRPLTRVSNNVEKRLGGSTDFYRKALTSESEGYGLGAVAYFRRVVEDKTNELIDVVADASAAFGVGKKDVENLRAAKNEKVFDDKLKIAAQAMPEVLKPDGANPLQALHSILSVGIHTQTEEECLQMAKEIQDIFEYLFVRLRAEIEDRTSFVAKVKAIASKRGQRADTDAAKK
jgi:hypothetical protein